MICRQSTEKAQMAELVDALGSGPNARKGVEVRVFFWAPVFFNIFISFLFWLLFWLPALATKQVFFTSFQAAWNFYRQCEPDQSQAKQSPKIIFNFVSLVKNNFRVV